MQPRVSKLVSFLVQKKRSLGSADGWRECGYFTDPQGLLSQASMAPQSERFLSLLWFVGKEVYLLLSYDPY